MADVPHQGPNLSRMPLEGTGGLIIAALPALCLFIATPLGFLAWIAAGLALVPFIYWANHRAQGRDLASGVVGLSLGMLLVAVVCFDPTARGAVCAFVGAGLVAAAFINRRTLATEHPSIRRHA